MRNRPDRTRRKSRSSRRRRCRAISSQLTAGELEQISAQVDGITVSVITIAGKREQARFALKSAVEVLRYFNDYFGVKYPLPKLDLIAIPNGYYVSAMEHWGAITFQDYRLLFNPATSSRLRPARDLRPDRARDRASVVRQPRHHELVGQSLAQRGFRDLDGIQGHRAIPPALADLAQQQRREAIGDAAGCGRQRASDPPAGPRQVGDVRICSTTSPTTKPAPSCACSKDTWVPRCSVPVCASTWPTTPTATRRRPICGARWKPSPAGRSRRLQPPSSSSAVCRSSSTETKCLGDKQQRMVLRQEPFTLNSPGQTAGALAGPDHRRAGECEAATAGRTRSAAGPGALEIPAGRCGDAVKLNSDDTGYYRVQYDAAMRTALIKSFALLSPADRVNMLADAWALVEAGRAEPTVLPGTGRTDRRRQPSGLGAGDAGVQGDRPPAVRPARARRFPGLCALEAAGRSRPHHLGRASPRRRRHHRAAGATGADAGRIRRR